MKPATLAERAAVLFRDYEYRLELLSGGGRCMVASRSFPGLGYSAVHWFNTVTAALDHFCPIIADTEFTRRMVEITRPS